MSDGKVSFEARLAFAQLFEAKTVNGEGEPRFSAAFIIDPKSKDVPAIEAAIKAVATEKWKDKAAGVLKTLEAKDRICFKKGPRVNGSGEPYQGFEGKFSLNASSKVRPTIVDRDASQLTAQDGKPYSGCYVVAKVQVWAQDNKFGQRINATLRGVQFVRDGDSFGGGSVASENEFEDLSVNADDVA